MPATRIFVSYATSDDPSGARVAAQLLGDLQAHGAEVICEKEGLSDSEFLQFLDRELPRCQYLILVETPAALHSLRVQTTVNTALTLVSQQRMQAVLRLIAAQPGSLEEQPLWVAPRAFDASLDYPRARDKMLLELGLLSLDPDPLEDEQNEQDEAPTPVLPGALTEQDFTPRPLQGGDLPSDPDAITYPSLNRSNKTKRDRPEDRPWLSRFGERRRALGIGLAALSLVLVVLVVLGAVLFAHPASPAPRGNTTSQATPSTTQAPSPTTGITSTPDARPTSAPTQAKSTPTAPGDTNSAVTAAMLSTRDPYGAGGTLALNDPLKSDNSGPYRWATSQTGCHFTGSAYVMPSTGPNYCLDANTDFSNFVYQIQVTILQGTAAGIIFRAYDPNQQYYLLLLTPDGRYLVYRGDGPDTELTLLASGRHAAIHQGYNQPNLVAVKASGSSMVFYVNLQRIAAVVDGHYTHNNIGVTVGLPNEMERNVASYRYAKVWTL